MELLEKRIEDVNVINDATEGMFEMAVYSEIKMSFDREAGTGFANLEYTLYDAGSHGENLTIGLNVVGYFLCPLPADEDEAYEINKDACDQLFPYLKEKFAALLDLVGIQQVELSKPDIQRETFSYTPPEYQVNIDLDKGGESDAEEA